MNKKRAVSDRYLSSLFRQAVLTIWGERCAHQDGNCYGSIEVHHYQRRAKGVLRYDVKNGIPLCIYHHSWADSVEGREWCRDQLDIDYLAKNDIILNNYLTMHGLTRDEFLLREKEKLKAIIRSAE